MTGTSAEVDAGRIVVRPSFADMLACGQIPGGAWDRARRAWSFPATMQVAAAIRAKIRHLTATEQFDVLLAGAEPHVRREPSGTGEFTGSGAETALAPVNAPEPEVAIPEGMLTRPWRHQVAAYRFCLDKFDTGLRAILLAMGMGTGKTLVAIMLLLFLRARRVMIACPLRVVQVWVTQIERHVGIDVVVVALDEDAGTVEEKRQLAEERLRLAHARGVPLSR